jgi:hypothetical protein
MGYPRRRGLRESLESFAARQGVPCHVARARWRAEGLRLLHVPAGDVLAGLARIAPGVAVPTRMPDYIYDADGSDAEAVS